MTKVNYTFCIKTSAIIIRRKDEKNKKKMY